MNFLDIFVHNNANLCLKSMLVTQRNFDIMHNPYFICDTL